MHVELLTNLEADVPTTAEDNDALWRARELNAMGPAEYLEFLLTFTEGVPASRKISAFDEPFTLDELEKERR